MKVFSAFPEIAKAVVETARTVVYTIVGVVVGLIVLAIVLVVVVCVCCCRRQPSRAGTVFTPQAQPVAVTTTGG